MKLKELEKRLKQEPDNLGLKVNVAGLMREAGRSVEAVELYRSVALAYRDQGRNQQALAVCRSILEIAPDDPACLGLVEQLHGRSPRPSAPPSGDIEMEAGTPPSIPSLRRATRPPAIATSIPMPGPDPKRRSSFGETPLPHAVPYHVVDPTTAPANISERDLADDALPSVEGAETRPGEDERPDPQGTASGLAHAARRISGLFAGSEVAPSILDEDLASELETRQRPKIDSDELHKISRPPPTVPVERVDLDDLTTPPPRATPLELTTDREAALASRDSDEELTRPRERLPTKDEDDDDA